MKEISIQHLRETHNVILYEMVTGKEGKSSLLGCRLGQLGQPGQPGGLYGDRTNGKKGRDPGGLKSTSLPLISGLLATWLCYPYGTEFTSPFFPPSPGMTTNIPFTRAVYHEFPM